MPIFDYRCGTCAHAFEKLVRSADPAPACPACGAAGSARQLSAPTAPASYHATLAGARRQAAREGHFSHYRRSERPRGA